MENLIRGLVNSGMAFFDLPLDIGTGPCALHMNPLQEICIASFWILHIVCGNLHPALCTGLHDKMSLRQVLEPLREGPSPVERLRNVACVRS
jgi:hypothetical protein